MTTALVVGIDRAVAAAVRTADHDELEAALRVRAAPGAAAPDSQGGEEAQGFHRRRANRAADRTRGGTGRVGRTRADQHPEGADVGRLRASSPFFLLGLASNWSRDQLGDAGPQLVVGGADLDRHAARTGLGCGVDDGFGAPAARPRRHDDRHVRPVVPEPVHADERRRHGDADPLPAEGRNRRHGGHRGDRADVGRERGDAGAVHGLLHPVEQHRPDRRQAGQRRKQQQRRCGSHGHHRRDHRVVLAALVFALTPKLRQVADQVRQVDDLEDPSRLR